ncbi:acyltransferase family protein [Thermomonospora amylolytica]|uniref:acyltransferase family protein n=1 Tax=Thermomonospora amylolytica TaxID=1411117 RepID=UPI000E6CBEDA|nr:acyltransferase [Thermomonospora amylolytica]
MTPSNAVMPAPDARLRELDLLRFVAALAVVLHHEVGRIAGWGVHNHDNLPYVSVVSHFGNLGVDLFFLISGFVILMSGWGRGVGDFAVSRVVRLFPAYWFGVTLVVVLYLLTGIAGFTLTPDGDTPLLVYLPNMTMMEVGAGAQKMETVYWTLWVELHFYALAALLIWRGITYSRCVGFLVGWLLLGVFAHEAEFGLLEKLLFPTWAPYFIAGMAFYLVYRFGPNLVLGLIITCCWALAAYYRSTIVNEELVWPGVWAHVTIAVVTVIFIIMALVATRRLSWLRWRGFTVLGALTYPLYLLHETLGRVLVEKLRPHMDNWELLGLCIVVSLTVSYLVYRLVETPAQRWMKPRLKAAAAQIGAGGARVPPPTGSAESQPARLTTSRSTDPLLPA